jgi:hypothetical protein
VSLRHRQPVGDVRLRLIGLNVDRYGTVFRGDESGCVGRDQGRGAG